MPETLIKETVEQEYSRLFAILEHHRIVQADARSEQGVYDRIKLEITGKEKLGQEPGVVGLLMKAALQQVSRPEVPGELPEAKRFHELHKILADKANQR